MASEVDMSNSFDNNIFCFCGNKTIPAKLKPFIKIDNNILSVSSDETGQKEISVYITKQSIVVADDLHDLVRYLYANTQEKLSLRFDFISHLLHDTIIPPPYTIYNEIFSLAIGNCLNIDVKTGMHDNSDNYPYLRGCSRQDSKPSTETLLRLMSDSLEQGTKNNEPLLLLSSGKDSVSLAIACGEIGLKGKAVTFKSQENDNESKIAQYVAKKCGLDHETIEIEENKPGFMEDILIQFFQESVHPCVDFAQIGYLQTLIKLGASQEQIIDGTGNDSYFGGAPSKIDYFKYRWSFGHRKIADSIKSFVRHSSKLSYLLRNDGEINFATRTFRYSESKKWYEYSFNTANYWRERFPTKTFTSKDEKETHYIDLEAQIRGRDYDRNCSFLKTRLASAFTNNKMFYPYCNSELIDYCFNLPEKYRFNTKKYINKILLRRLLNEKVQYDQLTKTKYGFDFEGRKFINAHRSFIRKEILSCNLWEPKAMHEFLNTALNKLENNYYESHGIMVLFLLSGWVNHNRYLKE